MGLVMESAADCSSFGQHFKDVYGCVYCQHLGPQFSVRAAEFFCVLDKYEVGVSLGCIFSKIFPPILSSVGELNI